MTKKHQKGFTIIEMLVYVAVLSIMIVSVVSFFIWTVNANAKAKAIREVTNNSRIAMDSMIYEIKEAGSIYNPTTAYFSNPRQLSLQTTKYIPLGEASSYVDFYLCGTRLCMKKESQPAVAMTSERVKVTNLVFSEIQTSPGAVSIQINLTVEYNAPSSRPEYQSSLDSVSVVSLRSY